jgi:uncharacterized membrane protein YhaH (DUF805 family)
MNKNISNKKQELTTDDLIKQLIQEMRVSNARSRRRSFWTVILSITISSMTLFNFIVTATGARDLAWLGFILMLLVVVYFISENN